MSTRTKYWTKIKPYVIVLIVVVAILSAAYILKFASGTISNDTANWGQFGDYFSMIINLAGTAAIFILSYLVYRSQQDRDDWEKSILELNDTPILVFTSNNDVYDRCLNVGKGSAHKVIIGKIGFTEEDGPQWIPNLVDKSEGKEVIVKGYSIPANGFLQIKWNNNAKELFGYYESILGKKYLVKCKEDENVYLISGVADLEGNSNKHVVDWLFNNAERHNRVSLKMI
jgi:hypothetical protein